MADKQISLTIKDPTLANIGGVNLVPNGGGSVSVVVTYTLKDSTGADYKTATFETTNLSAAAKTAIVSWLNANVLPAIRVQEGFA